MNSDDDALFAKLRLEPDHYTHIQHAPSYIKSGNGENAKRKIYYNVEYDHFERSKIAELTEALKAQNLHDENILPPQKLLKFIYSTNFKLLDTVKQIKEYMIWYQDASNITLTALQRQYITNGTVYQLGRDKQMRPIIYVNIEKLDPSIDKEEDFTRSLVYILIKVDKYMMVPGYIENWIVFIDTCSKSVFNFPVKILGGIIKATKTGFPQYLEKMFIADPSTSLNLSWNVISALLDETTNSKIKFIEKDKFKTLHDVISPNQLEKKYSGDIVVKSHWQDVRIAL
eukprot:TRINITY_DN8548_c0_g1_i3.p1 TRINITY_DN8548_c0_g1~~TRINITY_DN8548_c0_g1_i3.p1  ORF type:complete len:285 (+),score=45.59 TRINITY_DN8548_c0_g1_i3:139-993(+)